MSPNPANQFKGFNLRSAVLIVFSLALLVFTIYKSGLKPENLVLRGTQPLYFILAVVVFFLTIIIHSIRAKIPWEPWFGRKNTPDTFNGLVLGNFYNCILPGNLGEGVRAWHFSRKNGVSFTRALASLGVEKYIDAFAFLANTAILLFLFPKANEHVTPVIIICLAIVAVVTTYIVLIKVRRVERIFGKALMRFARPGRWLYRLYYHIKVILTGFNKGAMLRYLGMGYAMFTLNVIQYYLVMLATGVPEPVGSITGAFMVAVAMVLIYIIPSAPGNVGVIHFGIYSLLIFTARINGMEPGPDVTPYFALYTVYLHLSYFLPEIVVGFIVLLKEKRWLF